MLDVNCGDLGFLLRIVAKVLFYVRIIVPILLIVLIVFDFAKVVTGDADEKAKNEAINKAVKRMIYAVIIFLVPTAVNLIFNVVDKNAPRDNNGSATSWVSCWKEYYK